MFTGLVEEVGKVIAIKHDHNCSQITLSAKKVLENLYLGQSIATNGVCLTVVQFTKETFVVDVMPETMRRSNLSHLKIGSLVHLERALKLSDRLGGHMVSGHIDGTGTIKNLYKEANAIWIDITPPKSLLKYMILKGSIAIDGISLTISDIDDTSFKVSIIPHTQIITTLTHKKKGDVVNLECDMLGKYIEKLLFFQEEKCSSKKLSMDLLKENGFL